jgi:ribosomal protein L11 methyltransferase
MDEFWQQLHFDIPQHLAENAADALMDWGALSVTFQDPQDDPIYEPAPNTVPLWQTTHVTALFERDADVRKISAQLDELLPTALTYRIEILAEQDWVRAGQMHFKAQCFGGRLWICPSWESLPDQNALSIALDPGLAFGTGSHPTTALCLEWLARQEQLTGQVCIDYGCGSGILALAAAKLGAAQVWAVDHEAQALQATRENAAHNNVAAQIHTVLPADLPAMQADCIVANILANPLCELAPTLAALARPGAPIILSGILTEQRDKVKAAYLPYVDWEQDEQREDWVCLVGQRR